MKSLQRAYIYRSVLFAGGNVGQVSMAGNVSKTITKPVLTYIYM